MFPSQIYRLPILTFIHLGFVLDSVSMTAPCPRDGTTRLLSMCRNEEDIVTVHDAECIPGTMEPVCSMTPFVCCTTVLPEVAPGSISFC